MTGPPGRRLGCLFRLRLVEPQETGYTAKSHMRKLNRSEQLATGASGVARRWVMAQFLSAGLWASVFVVPWLTGSLLEAIGKESHHRP